MPSGSGAGAGAGSAPDPRTSSARCCNSPELRSAPRDNPRKRIWLLSGFVLLWRISQNGRALLLVLPLTFAAHCAAAAVACCCCCCRRSPPPLLLPLPQLSTRAVCSAPCTDNGPKRCFHCIATRAANTASICKGGIIPVLRLSATRASDSPHSFPRIPTTINITITITVTITIISSHDPRSVV